MREIEHKQALPAQEPGDRGMMPDMCSPAFNAELKARVSAPEQSPKSSEHDQWLAISNCFASNDAKDTDDPVGRLPRGSDRFWGKYANPSDVHTGRRALGRDMMEHLNDWDWLIEHKKELGRAVQTAYGAMTPEAFKEFMKELNQKSDGKIYMETGSSVRCYLKRGFLIPDDKLMDSRHLTYGPTYQSGSHTHDTRGK